ncbi:MAG: hypothetical protein ACKOJF_10685 [Planctomycetaceae bacterium]
MGHHGREVGRRWGSLTPGGRVCSDTDHAAGDGRGRGGRCGATGEEIELWFFLKKRPLPVNLPREFCV